MDEAIKSIVHTVKSLMEVWLIESVFIYANIVDRKLNRVVLIVSIKGIEMCDLETGKSTYDLSIYMYDTSLYYSADSTYTNVLAFIAENRNESHAFLGRKQKIVSKNHRRIGQALLDT